MRAELEGLRQRMRLVGKGFICSFNRAMSGENLSLGFQTRSDTNRAVQQQEMDRDLKFCI